MARASDTSDLWAPDSWLPGAWAPDSRSPRLSLGRAVDLFIAAKAAEGASPKTITWYRMVLGRAARNLGAERPLDALTAPELRGWLLSLRKTLAPISVAGYVRGLKVLGNWCAFEELAEAKALRRLLDGAPVRDRAILLLFLDTGLRLSELAELRLADLRADGSLKVMGKGSRERIVPVGTAARQALVRYLRERGADPGEPIFRARRGGPLGGRGIQQLFRRLKLRAGLSGRCSPHTMRHTFARAYLVNGGDAFSLQRILGHATLDMVKRYVALADTDVSQRHRTASPADHLLRS